MRYSHAKGKRADRAFTPLLPNSGEVRCRAPSQAPSPRIRRAINYYALTAAVAVLTRLHDFQPHGRIPEQRRSSSISTAQRYQSSTEFPPKISTEFVKQLLRSATAYSTTIPARASTEPLRSSRGHFLRARLRSSSKHFYGVRLRSSQATRPMFYGVPYGVVYGVPYGVGRVPKY